MINVSIDDKEKDRRTIVNNFMNGLCKKDDDANRNQHPNQSDNTFSVPEVHQKRLAAFSLDYVMDFLREHLLENRDNEPFEFLDNDRRIRLTDAGRNRCDEYSI